MSQDRLGPPPEMFGGYAFDLDGTLHIGGIALPGAVQALARIRAAGRPVVFVTNNPLHTAEDYADLLGGLGIEASVADVVTATDALVTYLTGAHPAARLLVAGEPPLVRTLAAAGFTVTDEPSAADVVVASLIASTFQSV